MFNYIKQEHYTAQKNVLYVSKNYTIITCALA